MFLVISFLHLSWLRFWMGKRMMWTDFRQNYASFVNRVQDNKRFEVVLKIWFFSSIIDKLIDFYEASGVLWSIWQFRFKRGTEDCGLTWGTRLGRGTPYWCGVLINLHYPMWEVRGKWQNFLTCTRKMKDRQLDRLWEVRISRGGHKRGIFG